ncbi:MAG: hypothetical protein A2341_24105 [Deltaproteobacteria bacterium RIFOXYB12_FULL_58_9]|nr:MAG: hypothetical protein A2341_24105 [Deltaproteobacteria bacterium RIFOXYB12_FULL_58_9]
MLKILGVVFVMFSVLPFAARADHRGIILIHAGYGTPGKFVLQGRVLEGEGIRAADKDLGRFANVVDSFNTLETDELKGVGVEVEIDGRSFASRTDDDGVWRIESQDLLSPLPTGALPITVRATGETGYVIADAHGVVHIFGDEPGIAVISDFDDTVANSGVTDKKRLIARTLTKNAAQMEVVAGASVAFRHAMQAGARGVFYVSGSPQNLHERITEFLRIQQMPPGPILLKNFGEDPLTKHVEYKVERITHLMNLLPNLSFILVGDSGEKDPEIYRIVAERYPRRVIGIVIRRVNDADNTDSRLFGMTALDDYTGDPEVLAKLINKVRMK